MTDSLILTLDPRAQGGVLSMQREMSKAHVRLGLTPWLAYTRTGRLERFDLRLRREQVHGQPAASFGYLPSIEYLNYVVPAIAMRGWLARFPILQLVGGSHAPSMMPILARRPFVSWVATPFRDEIESRRAGSRPTPSVRVNHALLRANDALERWTYRYPGKVFALSDYTARRLADLTGHPRERFDVLRFPVDLARFTPTGPRWAAAPPRYLISVGRVDDERKNVPSLLRCFARIAPGHPDLALVVVGQVDAAGAVVRLARDLGIAPRVMFPGALAGEELAAAYRGADAYVMTSRQEGLGIVVLEAQASGLAAILMRCGGSDELIEEAKNGWLVAQGDEEGFAARLDGVLRTNGALASAGRAARARVEVTSSLEAFDRVLAGAYARVFGHSDQRRRD